VEEQADNLLVALQMEATAVQVVELNAMEAMGELGLKIKAQMVAQHLLELLEVLLAVAALQQLAAVAVVAMQIMKLVVMAVMELPRQ
jgi:hypothetical protein